MEISTEVAVILGALIGGSISIITTWLQQKSQVNRDLTRIAFEMGLKEYETLVEVGKTRANAVIPPLETFVTYYIEYLKIVKAKNFKIENLKSLRNFRLELNDFYQKNK